MVRADAGRLVAAAFRPVAVETPGQLLRLAEREQVPARHLVELHAQPLANDAALELEREEAVVAAL